jgi:hypothetical protein
MNRAAVGRGTGFVPGSRRHRASQVTLLGPVCVRAQGHRGQHGPAGHRDRGLPRRTPRRGVPSILARAIWPQGVADEVRDGVLAAVASWLGTDGIGRPHLAADASGRLRLGSGVKVDWHVFLTLVAQAGRAAGAAGGKSGQAEEEAKLAQALHLAHRPVLPKTGRAWLRLDRHRWAGVRGVRPGRRCRAPAVRAAAGGGDPRGAMATVRTWLRIAPRRRTALAGPADRRARHGPGELALRRGRARSGPGPAWTARRRGWRRRPRRCWTKCCPPGAGRSPNRPFPSDPGDIGPS